MSNTDFSRLRYTFDMNLRQINQFVTLASQLNFRKAAELLNMAQPPLSIAIRRLEDELGAPLFFRDPKGLRLTTVGESILDHARQMAFHADQIKQTANYAINGIGGPLRVGFVGTATYRLFPLVLPAFRAKYPHVILDLREGSTSQIVRQVEYGELDLGLVRYPVIESTGTRLIPVEHDRLIAALPASCPLAGTGWLRLQDLAEKPFILYSAGSVLSLRAQVLNACFSAGFTPKVAQEAVQVQTVLSLVESGIGVALVPSVSQANSSPSVAFRGLRDTGSQLDIALATVSHPETEPAVATRFRDMLSELALNRRQGTCVIEPA
ncbi:LysR family transcriptional regulator [Paraburkholderia graminis]|uniref:LysR family transcriptional regulator n=1 Tax=Paraburkholderia graminis TaxID=60548 RepID=UPI0038BBDE42